jgi:hypothetical protein
MRTMRFPKAARAVVASVLLVTGSSAAFAGDACKNVKLIYKNMRPEAIWVYKIDYYNRTNAKVQTEDVQNEQCNGGGQLCITNGDNLRDSEGQDLTNFVFHFFINDQLHIGSEYFHSQPKLPGGGERCVANKVYSGTPTWEIN